MSLAHAIAHAMQAHGLKTAEIAALLGMAQDRTTFHRMLNGATKEPRLVTVVQLCIALETTPSELLELAGVWSPDTPGHAGPDDLRLRQAFGQIGELPMDGKKGVVPLVTALATALGNKGEQGADDDPGREPAPASGM